MPVAAGIPISGFHCQKQTERREKITDMTEIQAVISCLDVFSRAPDKASLDAANTWLQDFQHSVNSPFTFGPI